MDLKEPQGSLRMREYGFDTGILLMWFMAGTVFMVFKPCLPAVDINI
jgi:hypothetical protein